MSEFTHPSDFGEGPFTSFSHGYVLCERIDVRRWSDELAGMTPELYEMLSLALGGAVVGFVGGQHYVFRPMEGIPRRTAAVPRANHTAGSVGPLLLQKP